jgi:hypothetical protein
LVITRRAAATLILDEVMHSMRPAAAFIAVEDRERRELRIDAASGLPSLVLGEARPHAAARAAAVYQGGGERAATDRGFEPASDQMVC